MLPSRQALILLFVLSFGCPGVVATQETDPESMTDEELRIELLRREGEARSTDPVHGFVESREPSTEALARELNRRYGFTEPMRLLPLEEAPASVQDHARSVCAIVRRSAVHPVEGDSLHYRLRVVRKTIKTLGDPEPRLTLHPDDLRGTGFLITSGVVATSMHNMPCAASGLAFVFGLSEFASTGEPLLLEKRQVYFGTCTRAYAHGADPNPLEARYGQDWALFGLDRGVEPDPDGKPRIRLPLSTEVPDSASVYIVGHPFGLPLRYQAGKVVRTSGTVDFQTDLCTFPANSGSPILRVVEGERHPVIGVHSGQDRCVGIRMSEKEISCAAVACGDCCGATHSRIVGMSKVVGEKPIWGFSELEFAGIPVIARTTSGTLQVSGQSPLLLAIPTRRGLDLEFREGERWRSYTFEAGGSYRVSQRSDEQVRVIRVDPPPELVLTPRDP